MSSRYLTETLTFTRRVLRVDGNGDPVRDGRGNDIYDEVDFDVPECSVEPRGTPSEYQDRRDEVTGELSVYCQNPDVPVTEKDAMTRDGVVYEVDGPVARHTGAVLRQNNYSAMVLKRRTG